MCVSGELMQELGERINRLKLFILNSVEYIIMQLQASCFNFFKFLQKINTNENGQ